MDDKVFVRQEWVDISNGAINNLIGAPVHEENDYSVIMEEGLDTNELVRKLCQSYKEVIGPLERTTKI